MIATVAARSVSNTDLDVLRNALTDLSGGPLRTALDTMISAVARGVDTALLEQDKQLTPNEAARILGMSRQSVMKYMDSGALAYTRVQSNRRIATSALLDFAARREAAGKFVAEALSGQIAADDATVAEFAPATSEAIAAAADF